MPRRSSSDDDDSSVASSASALSSSSAPSSASSRKASKSKRSKKDKSKKSKRDKTSKKSKKEKSSKKSGKKKDKSSSKKDGKRKELPRGLTAFNVDAELDRDENVKYLTNVLGAIGMRTTTVEPPEASNAPVEAPVHPLLQAPKTADPSGNGALTVTNANGSPTGGVVGFVAPDPGAAKRNAYMLMARESRRVHVSHIPSNLPIDELRRLFTHMCSDHRRQMIEAETGKKVPESVKVEVDRVVDVHVNTSGAVPYAFVELSTDDMCTRLINGDQFIEFPLPTGGVQRVKCRRPRDYRPMDRPDDRRVILIGVADPEGSVESFREIFTRIGEHENFAVIPDRGFYVEFVQPESAQAAVRLLNGEVLVDHAVVCQLATECVRVGLLCAGLPVTGLLDEGDTGLNKNLEKDVMQELLNMQVPLAQALGTFVQTHEHLKVAWPMILPTRILCLLNLFDPEELTESETSFEELRDEIEREVERYGRVERLIINREKPVPPEAPDVYVAPPKPRPPTTAFALVPTERSRMPGFEASSTALVDPSGLSDAAYRVELDRWAAECKAGEERYAQATDEFMQKREQWERDCLHPVFGSASLGRVFVEYVTAEEAEAAHHAISGRLFNGRTIITSFLFEDVLYPPPEGEGTAEDGNATVDAADHQNDDGDSPRDAPATGDASGTAGGDEEHSGGQTAADDID